MATYYIKNGGNDSADGLSDATAWATLGKVQNRTIAPGDVFLFARGSKWREQIFFYQKSGTVEAPYRLGAYGTGALPEFIGSNVITGWVTESAAGNPGENFTDVEGDAPVTHWALTETSGNRVSSNGGDILVPSANSPTKGTGPGGLSSVEFVKANSQQFSITDANLSASFPGKSGSTNTSITVGAWLRIDSETGGDAGIWGKDLNFRFLIEGNRVRFQITDASNGNDYARENIDPAWGVWKHYIGRWNSTTGVIDLFANGVKVARTGIRATRSLSTVALTMGVTTFKTYFDGGIAEPFAFNVALTDSQILSIASKGLNGTRVFSGVENYYYAPLATKPGFVYLNNTLLTPVATKAALVSNSVFYDDPNDRLYVQTAAADNPSGYTVEACVRDFLLRPQLCNNWIVEDIHFRDAAVSGAYPDNVNNCEMHRCEFSRNTHNGVHLYTHTDLTSSGFKFIDCYAHHNGGTGITIAGEYALNMNDIIVRGCETHNNSLNMALNYSAGIRPIGREITNCIVEDNHIHDEGFDTDLSRGCGIWWDTVGAGAICRRNLVERTTSWGIQVEDCSDMVVESNIVVGTIHFPGIALIRDCDNNIVRNNTMVDCKGGFDLSNFNGSHFSGNQIYNNVVKATTGRVVQAGSGVATSANASFNKNSFGPERANFIYWNADLSTYAAWETSLGASSNSFQSDVTFTDSVSGNYRLTDASVGKNAGAPVPDGTLDFSKVAFSATTPSIGAYENVIVLPKLTKTEYKTKLAALRASLAGSGSFGTFAVFPIMHQTDAGFTDDDVHRVRQSHYEYMTENPSTVNLGWTPDVALSDGINQTAAGSEAIAYSYAHALLNTVGAVAAPSIGPKVTGVTRNGAVLTLAVTHNGGTSLKTQSGGTATGFQAFPMGTPHTDGGALAISAISLGANNITITLAADPGARVDVYYQYGKFNNTAPVFDNSTALGRTVGNPLQPLMAPVTSPVEVAPLSNPAVKLNGTDCWVRWSDSVRWDTPDANWTMGVFAKINSTDPNGAATTSYLLSGGNYVGANSFNLLLHESNAGSGNANKVEFSIRGAGVTAFVAKPDTADLTAVDANWRWWIMEFVKATETINVYYCSINGTRTLYATVAAPALGVVGPTTGPAFGTRAPPAVGSGLYLNGGVYEFFKLDGLLSGAEVAQMATGVNVRTGLGKATQIHHYFRSLTTPIADAAGTGLAAALNGPVELYEGPIYT